MIVLPTGVQGLRFRPALNLRTDDLDLGVEILRQAIASVAKTIKVSE
jgi:L-lysine 6-transaminase